MINHPTTYVPQVYKTKKLDRPHKKSNLWLVPTTYTCFPDSTRRGDVEAGEQQSNSSSTSFYTFKLGEIIGGK